jgi:hypothetical protein
MLKPYDFFFELPLYTKIDITESNRVEFIELIAKTISVDGYNPRLKENTTYSIKSRKVTNWNTGDIYDLSTHEGLTHITLACVRTKREYIFLHYLKTMKMKITPFIIPF